MKDIKSESFTNSFDIGMPKAKASWTIPSGELREWIPKGESIEDVNKAKNIIREYSKRTRQIVINRSTAVAGFGTLYTIPENTLLYIDTIQISAEFAGGGSGRVSITASSFGGANIADLWNSSQISQNQTLTFNNPLILNERSTLGYDGSGTITRYSVIITGWLEDKTLLG